MAQMKPFKLKIHQKNFSEDSMVFNSCDLPDVKRNDLLKINHCGSVSTNYLLFQVKTLKDGLPKDTISVEKSLANSLGLQVFEDVIVVKVEPEEVTVDLLEVSFKDQYISRSDMWRMKKYLVNSCAFIDQYLDYSDIRAQISELWVNSRKVSCGYISDSTNFVLRSFTAKVYVFIQMSSEMWEYDAYGYLQFERAVNGFLKALFTKWREKKCCHELTLVLFSRTFYETQKIEDFPETVRESVRRNYRGEFYLDFYKCVVQTEKKDDCTPLLTKLMKLFHRYEALTNIVGCPKGRNSTSSEGNFLEAINMSLNVFQHHNVDRNFDRTGQIVVCITPGVGVFDVDRDLTILTKERMIDNGIGSDLICLGQQPLHAVPLFKFHHKSPDTYRLRKGQASKPTSKRTQLAEQDFNIPHWINHSFYTSNPFPDKGTTNINYIPRIHVPMLTSKKAERRLSSPFAAKTSNTETDELPVVQQISYADYDKQVFSFQKPSPCWKQQNGESFSGPRHSTPESYKKKMHKITDDRWTSSPEHKRSSRPMHIPLCKANLMKAQEGMASSLGAAANLEKRLHYKQEEGMEVRPVIGSATTSRSSALDGGNPLPTQRRALFNPFNPSHMFAPLTANRRRWVHTYPRGPQGEALVLHHHNPTYFRRFHLNRQDSESADEDGGLMLPLASGGLSPSTTNSHGSPKNSGFNIQHLIQANLDDSDTSKLSSIGSHASSKSTPTGGMIQYLEPSPAEGFATNKGFRASKPISSYGLSWIWGIAGDTQWTPDTNTGLDWKSLKCPACLPITTDYCPLEAHLRSAYTEQSYTLVPDDVTYNNEKSIGDEQCKTKQDSSERDSRSPREIFLEFINQRLCQGFQIIKQSKRIRNTDSSSSCATLTSQSEGSYLSSATGVSPNYASPIGNMEIDTSPNVYMLSHGRQYHVLRLSNDEGKIEVKIYKPKHPFMTVPVDYHYMLWPKTRAQFQSARSSFAHEKREDYYWNHLDDYVCDPEENDFQLSSNITSWQTKFVVISSPSKRLHMLKSANENKTGPTRYDVFDGCNCKRLHNNDLEMGECCAMTEGFIRFLEYLNKFKRKDTQNARRSWKSFANFTGNLSKSFSTVSSSSGLHGSNHATPTPPTRPTSSTPSSERSTPIRSFLSESATIGPPPSFSSLLMHGADSHIAQPIPVKITSDSIQQSGTTSPSTNTMLSTMSDFSEIISAMKNTPSGLNFLPEQNGLPKYTFVSLEAVHWAIANMEDLTGIKEACNIFERMRGLGGFIHVSEDPDFSFVYGYFLYRLKDDCQPFELEDPTSYQYQASSIRTYPYMQNRWFEVAINRGDLERATQHRRAYLASNLNCPQGKSGAFYVTPNKGSPHDKVATKDTPTSKVVKISLMNKLRTNRTEWCQIKYSPKVRVGTDTLVFCFELQWMVATATCLFNMLQTWYREASRCDLYFFPVPCDPFAFPRTGVTGPLRSPLFVPLNLQALLDSSPKFEEYKQRGEEYRDMIIAMMETILVKFGFLRDTTDESGLDDQRLNSVSRNYIHCTGQVFAQIPVQFRAVQRHSVSLRRRGQPGESPKHVSNETAVTQAELDATGFYWSFNYMQTKRWRLLPQLGEFPPTELERDFVKFCANTDSRLIHFFEEFI